VTPHATDASRAEAFAERLCGILNGGALSLLLSIGHRLGLFDVMAGLPAASPETIAREAGLDVSYVGTWLAALAAGGVVELDAEAGTYRLPPEGAALLARGGKPWSPAVCAQWIPMLGAAEERLLACFERGGGMPCEEIPRWHAVVAEQSEPCVPGGLVGALAHRAPGLEKDLRAGIDVLDVGCGRGAVLRRLARAYPRSRFRGIDVSPAAIVAARAGAPSQVRFALCDAADLRETQTCDLVTAFRSLSVMGRPEAVLASLLQALRPAGLLVVQEVALLGDPARDRRHPLAPFAYTMACLSALPVVRATDDTQPRTSGPGSLGPAAPDAGPLWGQERLRSALLRAGFVGVETLAAPDDPAHVYHLARRPA